VFFFLLLPFTDIGSIIYSKVKYDIHQKENVSSHQNVNILVCLPCYINLFVFRCQHFRSKGRTCGFWTSVCYF